MKNKANTIIWAIAIIAVIAAAYIFYSSNKGGNSKDIPLKTTQSSQVSQSSQSDSSWQTSSNETAGQDTTGESSGQNTSASIMAPDFSLKDLSGNTVKLSDYKGKIVILNFWAVWCKYCKLEMPDLNELNSELEKDGKAVILAVDSQEPAGTVKDYLDKNNINLRVLLDSDGSITQKYGITGFPTTFIINTDGSVYTYIPGATDKKTLLEILDKVEKGEPAQ